MRSYYGKEVKISGNGVEGFPFGKVEMWTECNHTTIYSGIDCIYDGYHNTRIFDDEVERLCNIAKEHGFEVEVVRV